jgi:spermidine synthase
VIEVAKEFFIEYIDSFNDDRVSWKIDTMVYFVRKAKDSTYDVVIVDAMAPVRTREGEIFEEDFFKDVHRILKDDGLCAAQAGSWWLEMEQNRNVLRNLGKYFLIALPYRYEMYLYPGCIFTSAIASKKYHPTADIVLQRADLLDNLKYYNSDVHKAAFALPNFVEKSLKEVLKK